MVHEPRIASVPPLSERVPEPVEAPVMLPPHELDRAGVEATVSPVGKVSVKLSPVRSRFNVLVTVMESVALAPALILVGEKLLVM
jgi:hypothetical protein